MKYNNPNDYWQPKMPEDDTTRALVIIIICAFAVIGFVLTSSVIMGLIFW